MTQIESEAFQRPPSSAHRAELVDSGDFEISALLFEDAEVIARWATEPRDAFWVAPNTPPPIAAEVIRNWSRRATHAWVLRQANRPTAYGELNPLEPSVRTWWIGHMLVNPQLRGRGVCRILTRALLHRAFEVENAREVLLIVFPQNRAAIRAYEACGFRTCGYEHDYYAPYDCTVRMMRMRATGRTYKRE